MLQKNASLAFLTTTLSSKRSKAPVFLLFLVPSSFSASFPSSHRLVAASVCVSALPITSAGAYTAGDGGRWVLVGLRFSSGTRRVSARDRDAWICLSPRNGKAWSKIVGLDTSSCSWPQAISAWVKRSTLRIKTEKIRQRRATATPTYWG